MLMVTRISTGKGNTCSRGDGVCNVSRNGVMKNIYDTSCGSDTPVRPPSKAHEEEKN